MFSAKYNINYGSHTIKQAITRGTPIVQLTLEGDYVNSFYSIGKAAQETGISFSGIRYAVSGEYLTASGYCWVYEKEYEECFRAN